MEDRRNPILLETRKPWEDASDGPFKARNPDFYYENLHIECYYFCQQCQNYFETSAAKSHKRVPFTSYFLKNRIFFCWQQHKNKIEHDKAVLPSWKEFKAFL